MAPTKWERAIFQPVAGAVVADRLGYRPTKLHVAISLVAKGEWDIEARFEAPLPTPDADGRYDREMVHHMIAVRLAGPGAAASFETRFGTEPDVQDLEAGAREHELRVWLGRLDPPIGSDEAQRLIEQQRLIVQDILRRDWPVLREIVERVTARLNEPWRDKHKRSVTLDAEELAALLLGERA